MKIDKFVFKKYKLVLFFILIIFANQSVYAFANLIKNKIKEKINKVYYKNKFFDELDHPVIIEKSEKRKNYIKPNIVIPKSNYKTVAKNIDERDLMSLDFKEGSNKFFYKDNRDEIDKKVISSMKEIVFDSDGNKNFPDISSYKSADIIKDGKEIIQLLAINENKSNYDIKEIKQSNNLSNLDKFRQIDISTDNKIDALELNNKNKSVVDDKGKENVYFAENDIDYLINKKLRESSDAKDFTRINLKNKIEKLDLNIHKNENSEWMNKLDELNKELLKNLKENPSQYNYYIDEFKYDIKELLLNKDIINIGIRVKKDYYDENIPELMKNEILNDRNKNVEAIEKINEFKIKEEKTNRIEIYPKTKTNQILKINKENSENSEKGSKSELKEKNIEDKIVSSINSKFINEKFNDLNNKNKIINLQKFKEIEKEDVPKIKTSEKKINESNRKNKIDIEKEGIDKNSLLAELINSLE